MWSENPTQFPNMESCSLSSIALRAKSYHIFIESNRRNCRRSSFEDLIIGCTETWSFGVSELADEIYFILLLHEIRKHKLGLIGFYVIFD